MQRYVYIRLPEMGEVQVSDIRVENVWRQLGDRVYKQEPMLRLRIDRVKECIVEAPSTGWISAICSVGTRFGASEKKAVLCILDTLEAAEYRVDASELSPMTELGQDSRRALERAGEAAYGTFSRNLIEPSVKSSAGYGQSNGLSLMRHPLLSQGKTGADPKSNIHAADNPEAQENFNDMQHDLELRKQLSPNLQQQLGQSPSYSQAPTLMR